MRRFARPTLKAFGLQPFAFQLAGAAHGFGFFPGPLLRRFFIGTAAFHFPPEAFALHFFLQHFQGLIDVVVTYTYIQMKSRNPETGRKKPPGTTIIAFSSAADKSAAIEIKFTSKNNTLTRFGGEGLYCLRFVEKALIRFNPVGVT